MIDGPTLPRMKPVGWVLLFLGLVIAGVGIYLGKASVNRDSTDCGSGFGGVSDKAFTADLENAMEADLTGSTHKIGEVQAVCESAVSDRKTLAWAVVAPGGALAVAGLGLAIAGYSKRETIAP